MLCLTPTPACLWQASPPPLHTMAEGEGMSLSPGLRLRPLDAGSRQPVSFPDVQFLTPRMYKVELALGILLV